MRVVWDAEIRQWRELIGIDISGQQFAHVELGGVSLGYLATSAEEYIVPGLIDLHTHIALDGRRRSASSENPLRNLAAEPIEITVARLRKDLENCLRSGITTICDLGWFGERSLAIVREVEKLQINNNVRLPRIFTSGGFLTRVGGHAAEFGIIVNTQEELLRSAEGLVNRGAHLVKVMNDPVVFSAAELRVLKEFCNSRGVKLCIHAFTEQGAAVALDAGVDILAHAGNYSQETMARLAENRTFVMSTFVAALDTCADRWGTCADDLLCDAHFETFESWYESVCQCVPEMYARNVRIVCGTDAGFPGTPFDSLPREVCALNALGIPMDVALNCATLEAGNALGMPDKLGQIRSGALADYCIYDRNPLVGESRLRNPVRVYIGGEQAFEARPQDSQPAAA